MMRGRYLAGPLRVAAAVYWLSMIAVIVLFFGTKLAVHATGLDRWGISQTLLASGRADVLSLFVFAVAMGIVVRGIYGRMQRRLESAEHGRMHAEVRAAENDAVVRVCRTMITELAQPLSGAMAYSELLAADARDLTEAQKYEVRGLREGVLRMDDLLKALRDMMRELPEADGSRHFAEEVEESIGAGSQRQILRFPRGRSGAVR